MNNPVVLVLVIVLILVVLGAIPAVGWGLWPGGLAGVLILVLIILLLLGKL